MSAATEMPRYKSHKEVWALKIKRVLKHAHPDPNADDAVFEASPEFEGAHLVPETPGYAPIAVDAAWYRKHDPQEGGYYVVYEDGYASWSPAEAFEKGYTQVSGPPNEHMTNYVKPPHVLSVYENYVQAVRYARQVLQLDPVTPVSYDSLVERAGKTAPPDSPIYQEAPKFAFDYTPLQRALAYEMRDHLAIKGQL